MLLLRLRLPVDCGWRWSAGGASGSAALSEREVATAVRSCAVVVAVSLALLLFWPDLSSRFRRSPLFLPVRALFAAMESEKHGERVRQRERQRGSSAFWLRLWPQSRIQLVAAQTRIAQYGRLELESSAISVLSIAAFANSKIVLIEVPRNRSSQNDQNQSQKRGVSQVPLAYTILLSVFLWIPC